MAICSANSYSFGFRPRSKSPPLDIIEFFVTTLKNQDKKVSFIRVDEFGSLEIFYEFTRTCHNINIIVQNKCGDEPSLNEKNEIPNKTLANITIALLPNSIPNK